MLTRRQEFSAIQEHGTTRSSSLVTARFLRTNFDTTRFGLATSRRLGTAVTRNRVRRRLRESLRELAALFRPGWDVLVIARPGAVNAGHLELVAGLRRALERGGVIGETSSR